MLKKNLLFISLFCLPSSAVLHEYCFFYRSLQQEFLDKLLAEPIRQKMLFLDKFFEDLANQLFYEKFDGAVAKQLLLAFKPEERITLVGCLANGYYGFFGEKNHNFNLFFELNMYRLGFLDENYMRVEFGSFRKQLNITCERVYREVLKKHIDDYCSVYPCDPSDKLVFDKLITFTYSDNFLAGTKGED